MATRRRFLTLAAAGVAAAGNALSMARAEEAVPDGSTIVIVRHADKLSGAGDVALSPQGEERAGALRDALKDARISAIVTTKALRSKQTARPLADALQLTPVEISRGDSERSEMEQAVRARLPGAVLVVGHLETVPGLVQAFGGQPVVASTYDNLFMIIRADGVTRFIRGRYGEASP